MKTLISELRALVEGWRCKEEHTAPSIEVIGVPGGLYPIPCDQADCNGLDPAFSGLLAVMRVDEGDIHYRCVTEGFKGNECVHWPKVRSCQGTGYVDRDWSGLPKGALTGALMFATEALSYILGDLHYEVLDCFDHVDPDEEAPGVVIEALKELTI